MVEQRVAAVLGSSPARARAPSGPSASPYGPVDAGREQALDGLGDVARVALAVVAERDRLVRRRLGDAGDAGRRPAVEDRGVLGDGDAVRGLVERVEVDVLGAAVGVARARRARP